MTGIEGTLIGLLTGEGFDAASAVMILALGWWGVRQSKRAEEQADGRLSDAKEHAAQMAEAIRTLREVGGKL